MANWLVPAIWIIGDIYMHYYFCVECRENLTEFAATVKRGMEEASGRAIIAMILVLVSVEVISFAWPVIGLIDLWSIIYRAIKGDSKT